MMRVASLLFHDVYDRSPAESGFVNPVADRYKIRSDDFAAALRAIASVRKDPPAMAPDLSVPGRDAFAVTVDDGGVSYYTHVADALEALGWRGHCFMSTDMIGQPGFLSAAQLRELDERGHIIGSHSASHPVRFSACTPERMRREWRDSRHALEDVLGHAVTIASLPGGYYSGAAARAARDAGIHLLFVSEPDPRLRWAHGCTLAGRFTVRRGEAPGRLAAIVRLDPGAIWREWTTWTLKKLVKPVLGPAYPRLGAWIASRSSFQSR